MFILKPDFSRDQSFPKHRVPRFEIFFHFADKKLITYKWLFSRKNIV